MVTWFCSIAAIGLYNISKFPTIFYAISPHHYIRLVTQDPSFGLRVASEVVLAITGVESMYADLGHFKALPIRTAFFCVVYPSLVLNYLGQGAMLLSDPQAAIHPFFASVPDQVKWVVLVLATLSAVIASQANMSGCFILIDQAISLRVFPNVRTIHVDAESAGAVYIPSFNNFMLFASISLILIFRDSESLSGIYGVGITFTMICTTTFYVLAMKYTWGYADWQTGLFSIFLIIDVFLAGASVMKFANFGWISICIGLVFFAIMYTWYTTTVEIQEGLRNKLLEMSELRSHVKTVHRTKGTVVFVSNTDEDVPNVLRICAEQLRSLPENIVCMSAISSHAPFIADEERTVFRTIDAATGIYRLVISYGYAERSINTVTAIERARKRGLRINPEDRVTFVVGREIVAADVETLWYKKLRITAYLSIASNTEGKIEYYNLPPADTLEIGSQMVIGKAEIEEEDEDDYTE
ncbi:potassium transporter-domain-containing protein [Chytridium lagenaria]|nr:potassium transporter-domain-containing protein [Chytridium lagenaria]